MKLIADSGGTKTQWCGVSKTGQTEIITTIGLNPNFISDDIFRQVLLNEVIPAINSSAIEEVWFYGAGCAGKNIENKVKEIINSVIPSSAIFIYSDLMGAARGMLGTKKGFICMIGTGSNSGYYDGKSITMNVPPLGFILGDEGSGAALGKKILADFIRGIMPADLADKFRFRYGAEKDDIVSHVYRGVFPSKFIGGFVRFIKEHISHEYCYNLVKTSFEEFVSRNLLLYNVTGKTEFAATGSVAWCFRDILEEVFGTYGLFISNVTKEPIEGLVRYHQLNY